MRRAFGFLIGTFVGGLFCGAVVLLLTPESGVELRAKLRSRFSGFFGQIQDAVDGRRAELEDHLAELRLPRPRD